MVVPKENTMADRTASELKFIDQRTRQLLVTWAEHCIRNPEGIPDLDSLAGASPEDTRFKTAARLEMHRVYFDHAVTKKWLGKTVKNGCRSLTSGGWSTAASFLKR